MLHLDEAQQGFSVCSNSVPPRQPTEPDNGHARGLNGLKVHLGIIRLWQSLKRRTARHDEPDDPIVIAAALQHGGGHRDLCTNRSRLHDWRRHCDLLLGGVAAKDIAGEEAKPFARGLFAVARYRHFGHDQRGIIPDFAIAFSEAHGEGWFLGRDGTCSQQAEPQQQGKMK